MSCLELAKQKLEEFEERKKDVLNEIKEAYYLEDDEDVEDQLRGGELAPEWREYRDYDYADFLCRFQNMLIRAYALKEDENSIRDTKKLVETLVRHCRHLKRECREDIEKAQAIIDIMDEIIDGCDAIRK